MQKTKGIPYKQKSNQIKKALSRKFAVKLRTGAIITNFAEIFVDIVSDGKQSNFGRNFLFAPK